MLKVMLFIVYILIFKICTVYAETPLFRHLNRTFYSSIRLKDEKLPLTNKLDKWFPYHQRIIIDNSYYLTKPYFNDIRADFFIKYDEYSHRASVIPDTSCVFTDSTIVLKNNEIIPASNLSVKDFIEIKNQISWLTVLFRTLGTPIPELMLGNYDDVDTFVIIYEDSLKQKVILPSFTETIKKLNHFYEGKTTYFKFNEVKKINSRLEFFGTVFIKDIENDITDFIDVRFHTNRLNEIDLVMFFIYRNV